MIPFTVCAVLVYVAVHTVSCQRRSAAETTFIQKELENAENTLDLVHHTVEAHAIEIAELKKLVQNKDTTIADLKYKGHYKRQLSENVVGFTAMLSRPLPHLTANQTIVFDKVITNVRGGYDNTSGVFVCPYSGLYEFASTLVSNGDHKNLNAEIVLDGVQIARIHCTLFEFDMGSQVVVTRCNEGQHVWVRHMKTRHDTAELPGGYSTFAGHLIYSDSRSS